jgi:pyruvate formate lyase activating enzyme
MGRCRQCGKVASEVAKVLGVCGECVRGADEELLKEFGEIHAASREEFGLAGRPVSDAAGAACGLCQNECVIGEGRRGYCGVRRNENGHITGGTAKGAAVAWYYDALPTNCVADWVCAGGSSAGWPEWSYCEGAERGYVNLAVFYEACTFDCLFCQNWHYRSRSLADEMHSARELADSVSSNTACICYFGGDPTAQLPHALAAARLARRQNEGRILRVCWETNGSMSRKLLDEMMSLSLESGGCVKFDLKAMDEKIHLALCGVSNKRTKENFAGAAGRIGERPEPPPLVASTLLVPGYVEVEEVAAIASFIADLDCNIPYALLGFHGDFLMRDLPATSRRQAEECFAAAEASGLRRVRIGNAHILR